MIELVQLQKGDIEAETECQARDGYLKPGGLGGEMSRVWRLCPRGLLGAIREQVSAAGVYRCGTSEQATRRAARLSPAVYQPFSEPAATGVQMVLARLLVFQRP